MTERVCPWWLGYFLVSPLRRLWQNPKEILRPFVTSGMSVFEPGCGMGFFTLELARLVGDQGKVVAVDIQPQMLQALSRRARKAKLEQRIDARLAEGDGLPTQGLSGQVEFALAFWVVHELPDIERFFIELYELLKPGGKALLVEPKKHVSADLLAKELELASRAGFRVESHSTVKSSVSVMLERTYSQP
ncbi:MAG: class I SAM-dependent methyltransferase [Gaiellaceae bacterium]